MNKSKRRNKWIWIILVGVVAVVAIGLIAQRVTSNAQEAIQEAGTGETVTAFMGDLSANASASGQIQAATVAQLALVQSGIVEELYVSVGESVNEGDPILQLETAELERAVLNAQQTVAIQEANLENILAPASAADIASAEAAVVSAEAALADLLNGPSADEIAKAEADIRAAEADIAAAASSLSDARSGATAEEIQAAQLQLDLAQTSATQAAQQHSTILVTEAEGFITQDMLDDMEFSARTQAQQANANLAAAQETFDQLLNGDANAISTASAQLAIANASRAAAQANYDLLLADPAAAQIAASEASVAQAMANLDRLQRGPTTAQITQLETAVAQAKLALETAENNLAEATLVAPFAGVVTQINVNEGEMANGLLVELVDDNSLEVVLDVDEIDIGKINEGQEATVNLESWPDEPIIGQVASISPVATQNNSAIVSYRVYVGLGETDLPVLVGMTANADLLTDNLEDVLLVPNQAINANRNTGTFTVNKAVTDADGNVEYEEIEVTIGLRDNRNTQITSGVESGDELLVGALPPRFQFGQGPPDGDNGGGGGGPFGGGG